MIGREASRGLAFVATCAAAIGFATVANAQIPAGYKGTPFDPKVAGGPKMPPTVKAGPYTIPGRLDFVNYDLGGDGIAYHTGDHLVKGGTGYRIDMPTATLSLTDAIPGCAPDATTVACENVWYNTSPMLDGTLYPSPTSADFTIGAVQNGDWFNFTVNVETTGTYSLSSTWATGNGPPGGEGGDGSMGLAVFTNGTKLATWSAVFPNSNMYADFHHWKAYPNFATVTLTAGPQVIKLQSGAKHLQLDYVEFDLVIGDGGLDTGDAGATASDASASTGATASGSTAASGGGADAATTSTGASATGAIGTTAGGVTNGGSGASGGAGSTTGATASNPSTGAAVSTSGSTSVSGGAGATGPGANPGATTSATGTNPGAAAATNGAQTSPSGCAFAAPRKTSGAGFIFALVLVPLARLRKRLRA
jgi:hypothetical protein